MARDPHVSTEVHSCIPEELSLNRLSDGSVLWDSLHALYSFSGLAQTVLRNQKKSPHARITELLTTRTKDVLESTPPSVDLIIPVGQNFLRKWELQGGSSWRLARIVQKSVNAPIEDRLFSLSSTKQGSVQGMERYLTPLAFEWQGTSLQRRRVLLVDDFLTSGRTLKTATNRIYAEGAVSVSVFVSGIRISPSARATIS